MYIRSRVRRQPKTSLAKRIVFAAIATCLVLLTPGSYAFAASSSSDPSANTAQCTPAQATNGTDKPTGAWASTFTYNSCTGLYENQYYIWSPVTHDATYIYPMVYTCNTAKWQWVAKQYVYVASHNDYEPVNVFAAQLPTGAVVADGSPATCTPPPPAPATDAAPTTIPAASNGSQANSTNTNSLSSTTSNATGLTNYIGSVALSGNALVTGNTTGGNATSGSVQAMANVLNSIQSSTSLAGAATFVANIDGNVQGDVMIDPSQIQPASGASALNSANNIDVNVKNNGQINNTINLSANSGNAGVTNNTTGGNATTGNAVAIADVMNMINSMVGANQSFVGVININGNLEGNILVPQHFLDSLLASNAPATTVTVPTSSLNSVSQTTNTTNAIMNGVSSDAESGKANVTSNTTGGNAATGSATTNVTIFNLTGSNVVGTNALLVFVNVLGKWVGVIMDAPAGTTAAALGSGVSANATNTATVNATTDNQITNKILLAARTGDAAVSDNTTGGNATTGNAATAVNLLNMSNTNYSLSNWFGILFINVFGSWYGNFGAFEPANKPMPSSAEAPAATPSHPQVFQFHPAAYTASAAPAGQDDSLPLKPAQIKLASAEESKVLASAVATRPGGADPASASSQSHDAQKIVGAALVLIGITLIVGERVAARLRARP